MVMRVFNSTAWVRIGGQTGCAACDAGKGCGAGLFGKLLKRHPLELELSNGIAAVSGQPVLLGLSEVLFLKLVFRLYGMPLGAGILGAAAGFRLALSLGFGSGMTDLATLVVALASMALVLIFWNRTTKPEVSASDIQLLGDPVAGPVCGSDDRQREHSQSL